MEGRREREVETGGRGWVERGGGRERKREKERERGGGSVGREREGFSLEHSN